MARRYGIKAAAVASRLAAACAFAMLLSGAALAHDPPAADPPPVDPKGAPADTGHSDAGHTPAVETGPCAGVATHTSTCSSHGGGGGAADYYGSGAYIEQIGDRHRATITQAKGNQAEFAHIRQEGHDDVAAIAQTGSAYAEALQTGARETMQIAQGGSAHNTLMVTQQGLDNRLAGAQTAYVAANAAHMFQSGQTNTMALVQDGDGNNAVLSQQGNNNTMAAAQYGGYNKLSWAQEGSNLPNLSITQTGGASISVYQSGTP